MVAIPKKPAAFKESSVEKSALAVCGATYWPEWAEGSNVIFGRKWSEVWLANGKG